MKWNKKNHPRYAQAWVYDRKGGRLKSVWTNGVSSDFKWINRKGSGARLPQKMGWSVAASGYSKKGNWVEYYGDRLRSDPTRNKEKSIRTLGYFDNKLDRWINP